MTDRQAKAVALKAVHDSCRICEKEYPPESVRLLIWFMKLPGSESLIWSSVPVICGKNLRDKALYIERMDSFYAWGINPWTGESANISINPVDNLTAAVLEVRNEGNTADAG